MGTKKRTIRRPQAIEESKMQGYFMISRRDAAIAITNKLTGSQCRLWLYLMLIDPFADYTAGGEIKYHDLPPIAKIAIAVGSSPDTVEKDLRKLRKLGLYEYRTVTIQGHNNTAANAKAESERLKSKTAKNSRKSSQDKDSAYLSPDEDYLSPDGDYLSSDGDYLSPNGAYLSGNEKLKTLPDKHSGAPSDRSDYSDFIQTLSEGERESFLEFGKKKANQLPKPPELPLKWIEVNFKELHEQWEKIHSLNQNQTQKYNFPAYSESQHQMWYGQLQTVVKGAIQSGNSFWLDQYLSDDFNNSWLNWAKVAREDVREFLVSNPVPEGGHYGS
ncbi:MAG: hypothetical protein AAFX80_19030 [Cyanobacteria bacterium J06639_18]